MNGGGCSRPKDVVGSASDYLGRVVLKGPDILQSDREHLGAFEDAIAPSSWVFYLSLLCRNAESGRLRIMASC